MTYLERDRGARRIPVNPDHVKPARLETLDIIAIVVGTIMFLMPLALTAYGNPYSGTNFLGMKMSRPG